MDTAAQDDTALVEAVRRGERAGLEGMYRRYADRLYTYARSMLREPEAAADAVHDAFLTASQRIGQLREPDRLRSWLYAIVRNECLRQLRERSRTAGLEEAGEPVADLADPTAGVNAQQVRDLVHTAAAALNPGDREVVHLAIRHDLSSAEIGAALGVPANHAHARLSRARAQLERALGALLVARAGARDCPTLAGLLDGWQGRLTPTLRKRVSRHIEGCPLCELLRREQLSPAALLSAYTAPGFLVVADAAWPRLAEAYATGVPADAASAVPADAASAVPADAVTGVPADATAGVPADATAGVPADAASVVTAHPASAVPADSTTGPAPTADEPADGPGDGLTPPAGGVGTPLAAAVPGAAAHAVPATPRAGHGRRRRRMATTAALLILLVVLGTWALTPDRPTAARDGTGRAMSETLGPPAGAPVAPAAAPLPSVGATAAGTPTAAPPTSADPAGPPARGGADVPAEGAGAARTAAPAAPDVVPGGAEPAPTAVPTRPPSVPRPNAPSQVAAAFTVSATAWVRCGRDTYSLVVRATGSAALGSAELRRTPSGGRTAVRAMTVDATAARVTVGRLRAPTLTWSVRATAADGRTAQSPTYSVTDPCVRPG